MAPEIVEGLVWETYDDFQGDRLSERWMRHVAPSPIDGSPYTYGDPSAIATVKDGALVVDIGRFGHSHDAVQSFDNVKSMHLSERYFEVPPDGVLAVSAQVGATMRNSDGRDLRDGFAGLHVIDFSSRMIFDIVSNGNRVGVIYERRPPDAPDSFLYLIDAPAHCPTPTPGDPNTFTVVIDSAQERALFLVDGTLVFEAAGVPAIPETVRIGLGILTVHPVDANGSHSLRGQGLTGQWQNIRAGQLLRR